MSNFNNMIQVLSYFADQCDMFDPMLQGVKDLNEKNQMLDDKIRQTNILYDRMQLNATYLADNANFGVEMVKSPTGELPATINIDPKNILIEDRYNLIKAVINIGKDNYDKEKMEQLLDFYNMVNILSLERYEELLNIIDEQHKEVVLDFPTVLPAKLPENTEELESTKKEKEATKTKGQEDSLEK